MKGAMLNGALVVLTLRATQATRACFCITHAGAKLHCVIPNHEGHMGQIAERVTPHYPRPGTLQIQITELRQQVVDLKQSVRTLLVVVCILSAAVVFGGISVWLN